VSELPKEKRTPAAWRNAVLAILRRKVHPDYEWNRAVKGRFVEFTRRHDPSGLVLTYSFVCIQGTYYSSYGVALGLWSYPCLVTPFMAGSRINNGRTISRLFDEDFGLQRGDPEYPPSGVWSFGEWRNNTLELLEERLPAPEAFLLPRYLAAFRAAKDRLVRFVELGAELVERFDGPPLLFGVDDRPVLRERAREFGCDPAVVERMQLAMRPDALRIGGALPDAVYGSTERLDMAKLDLRSVAFSQLLHFFEQRADLGRFLSTLRGL